MKLNLGWNARAALWTLVLFVIEVLIALFVRDALVRPYGGDVLATLLVYVALRTVCSKSSNAKLALVAFAIGCAIEVAQLFQVPARLGFTRNTILRIAMGTTFQWGDFIAYAIGATLGWLMGERTSWFRSSSPDP